MDAIARPGQLLSTHLDGVARRVRRLVPDEKRTPFGGSLASLVWTVGHLHDIGKHTSHFQQYVREDGSRRPTELETHSRVGAVLTLHALQAQGFCRQEAMAGFYAVLKHHGTLPAISKAQTAWESRESRYEILQQKLNNITSTAHDDADERVRTATDDSLQWSEICQDDVMVYQATLTGFEPDSEFYRLLVRVWSTLTCADKMDAADIGVPAETKRPPHDAISFETTASGIREKLNDRRGQARKNVREELAAQSTLDGDVFTLTLPTGFGKTAAGLEAALSEAHRRDSRVVYALPYTTVIDQIDDTIRKQFRVVPTGKAYTKHHHLADTRTGLDAKDESLADGDEVLYGETWQAGLVLTTFVQLFESLAGPSNVQSIKLPALQDAVIIVDEPQALPNRWWHLLSRLLSILADEYDATVILMTATQPRFVAEYNDGLDPTELVPAVESHFEFLRAHERVTFSVHESLRRKLSGGAEDESALTPTEAGNELVGDLGSGGQSTLVVNNTVNSAVAVGNAVAEAVRDQRQTVDLNDACATYLDENPEIAAEVAAGETTAADVAADLFDRLPIDVSESFGVMTLTAALRPCDRVVLIEAMRSVVASETDTPLDGIPFVISATQLVEAGVDISADHVYRDLAPLPAIVQAAGRCNRSFDGETGEVTMWYLTGTDNPPSDIYKWGGDRLSPTEEALRDLTRTHTTTIPEAEIISTGVRRYYEALYAGDHTTTARDSLASAVDAADGKTLREASLVEDHTEDAVVLRTDSELAVIKQYLDARARGDYETGQQAFERLKYFMASAAPERVTALATTESVLNECGHGDASLSEFEIIDARAGPPYALDGNGLRE